MNSSEHKELTVGGSVSRFGWSELGQPVYTFLLQ